MQKLLIIGDFLNDQEIKYVEYIIEKYHNTFNILISGLNYQIFENNLSVTTTFKDSDEYINYVFTADIVIILNEKIEYHKYKSNQRLISFNEKELLVSDTKSLNKKYKMMKVTNDIICFSSKQAKQYSELGVNFYDYTKPFDASDIKPVIDNLNIPLYLNKLNQELLIISKSPYLNIYSANNLHRLINKINDTYNNYNIILINMNLSEHTNYNILKNTYTSIVNIDHPNILKYIKTFEGIILYDNKQTLEEYKEILKINKFDNLSKKQISEDKVKLFFKETNLDDYFNNLNDDTDISADTYFEALNTQYNDNIKNKIISVIIPRYNTPLELLFRAIDSVFASDHKNIEVIVVDDGSKNNINQEIKNNYTNKKVKYLYQENQGPGIARNSGVKVASGDYIFFLDADDAIFENGLKLLLIHAETFNLDVVMGKRIIYDENDLLIGESFKEKSSSSYNVYYNSTKNDIFRDNMTTNKLYKVSIFKEKNIWFETGFYEDAIFTVLLLNKIKEYHYTNIPIYKWYKYGAETTVSSSRSFNNFQHRIIAYKKTWNIMDDINKKELLIDNIDAFMLYLPFLSNFNNNQQLVFFNELKEYVLDRLAYYSEVKTKCFMVLLVRSLINNDFETFLKLSKETN